jgi:hypothetical protein
VLAIGEGVVERQRAEAEGVGSVSTLIAYRVWILT